MAAKFGQKIVSVTKSNAILISSLNLPERGIFYSKTLHNKLPNYDVSSWIFGRHGLPEAIS